MNVQCCGVNTLKSNRDVKVHCIGHQQLVSLLLASFLVLVIFCTFLWSESNEQCRKEKKEQNELPYSRKYWRGIKFGGLAVLEANLQIKISQYIHCSPIIALSTCAKSRQIEDLPCFVSDYHASLFTMLCYFSQ